ncbi:adenylate kinase [Thioclava dalianensis]|uniref:Adenylate kinase n=1 Tax=Thioclava dalianensis TaxID=1185766 RepID=A0A074TGS5_9RHOB|nr:AAA family ATPase [Thioclava dalianensis]KEP69330.1 adenylate kinase [Thioclava dalianensis]SFN56973.1 Adenylate kinase [Thioclava dalianensis]
MAARVYLTGAAGSGTSSLGRMLAQTLGLIHLDTDDYYWAPTDPPFTNKRPARERLALIAADQVAQGQDAGWILSGSLDGWGEVALGGTDLIVFLHAPTPVRLARLRRREGALFGDRIKPDGDMHYNHIAFLKWAASYDEPYFSGRSLARHREWLAGRSEPILELSGTRPLEELTAEVLAALG